MLHVCLLWDNACLPMNQARVGGKSWLFAVWPAVALWPLRVDSFGIRALVAIVTAQLIGLSRQCRRRNVSDARSEVLCGFPALLQYGPLWGYPTQTLTLKLLTFSRWRPPKSFFTFIFFSFFKEDFCFSILPSLRVTVDYTLICHVS